MSDPLAVSTRSSGDRSNEARERREACLGGARHLLPTHTIGGDGGALESRVTNDQQAVNNPFFRFQMETISKREHAQAHGPPELF
ncbi:hypothetical protein M7I_6049 [Glarea lozoyensis 74030]|uniref:Uncharacterized protein n=1 Tax=Glarea lozoyensis (strain ATCC 74030 / MF5533) TaxID=1104152 RepID=H0ETI5_GLAL7|nr:hypothetical protein M7I_6049 [Glarea lozoyensis 74030]